MINTAEIGRRGGIASTDSDFVVVSCRHCGYQYLYDEETLTIYLEPDDLSVTRLNVEEEGFACRGCGADQWDFNSLDLDAEAVVGGPWGWVR